MELVFHLLDSLPCKRVKLSLETDASPAEIARLLNYPLAYVAQMPMYDTEHGPVFAAVGGDSVVDENELRIASGATQLARAGEDSEYKLGSEGNGHPPIFWDERLLSLPYVILREAEGAIIVETRQIRQQGPRIAPISRRAELAYPLSAYHQLVERGFLDR